jgi:antitoxin MazE
MQVNLTRWGRSLGLRIPKDLASRFRLTEGSRVEVAAEDDRIVISVPTRYRLEDLLVGTTPEAMRDAFTWDDDRGREIID